MITINQNRHALQSEIVAHHAAFFVSCIGGRKQAQDLARLTAVAYFLHGGTWTAAILHGVSTARTLMLRDRASRPPDPLDDDEHQANDPLPHGVRT